jgi:hypothetical protein
MLEFYFKGKDIKFFWEKEGILKRCLKVGLETKV